MCKDGREKFMLLAIEKAREGIIGGQTPFGACVVKGDEVIACEHNIVWQSCDITAHAEINAIRAACRKVGDVDLSGCVIYSTCEPCPMCFSAIHWAKIVGIVYGASIADAKSFGFSELEISNTRMKQMGDSDIDVVGGVLSEENIELFRLWKAKGISKVY